MAVPIVSKVREQKREDRERCGDHAELRDIVEREVSQQREVGAAKTRVGTCAVPGLS